MMIALKVAATMATVMDVGNDHGQLDMTTMDDYGVAGL